MKVGDLIKVDEVLHPDIHTVGIILTVTKNLLDGQYWFKCLWCDGDIESVLDREGVRVISEGR